MDPLATRWRASLTASFARAGGHTPLHPKRGLHHTRSLTLSDGIMPPGGFNDALFQDNLANNLWRA